MPTKPSKPAPKASPRKGGAAKAPAKSATPAKKAPAKGASKPGPKR